MAAAIPLLAAAGGIAAGVSAVAAGASVVGGLMIAGGALGGIGAVTGNQRLSQLGAVVGLAGGVAGLATGAWDAASSTIAQQAGKVAGDSVGLEGAATLGGTGATPDLGGASYAGAAQSYADPAAASSMTGMLGSGSMAAPGSVQPTGAGPSPALAPSPAMAPSTTGGGLLDSASGAYDYLTKTPGRALLTSGVVGGLAQSVAQQEALAKSISLQEGIAQRARDRLNASVRGVPAATAAVTYKPPGG